MGGRNQKRGHKDSYRISKVLPPIKTNGKKINGCVYLKLIRNIQTKKKNK
jgi:hypothetical protein